jgi:hypothetical protein
MTPTEVLRRLQARPFTPFRIRLSNNTHYDITHPELCIVGRTYIDIGMPDNPAEPIAARTVTVALIHVAELLPLNPGLVA